MSCVKTTFNLGWKDKKLSLEFTKWVESVTDCACVHAICAGKLFR